MAGIDISNDQIIMITNKGHCSTIRTFSDDIITSEKKCMFGQTPFMNIMIPVTEDSDPSTRMVQCGLVLVFGDFTFICPTVEIKDSFLAKFPTNETLDEIEKQNAIDISNLRTFEDLHCSEELDHRFDQELTEQVLV